MLRIPSGPLPSSLQTWAKELVDECMASSDERGMVYARAAQYYYAGSQDNRAAIYNKTKPFIDKLAGFLMQPTDVRFQIYYDTSEGDSAVERAYLCSEKLTADYRHTDSDVTFAESVVGSMTNG